MWAIVTYLPVSIGTVVFAHFLAAVAVAFNSWVFYGVYEKMASRRDAAFDSVRDIKADAAVAIESAHRERDVARNTAREHRIDALIECVQNVTQLAGSAILLSFHESSRAEQMLDAYNEAVRNLNLKTAVAGDDYKAALDAFRMPVQLEVMRALKLLEVPTHSEHLSPYERVARIGSLHDKAVAAIRETANTD